MRYSTVSIFFNFILILLLLFGAIYCYKAQERDAEQMLKLEQNSIAKTAVRFEDLSQVVQKTYLYIGNPDDFSIESSDTSDTNQTDRYIQELKKKLIVVQKDNLLLSDEKDKIQHLLLKTKTELIEQKKLLLSQNLVQMNDVEEQHYENISELRKRLNALQKENIDLIQEENEKVISLQNKIISLEKQLQER